MPIARELVRDATRRLQRSPAIDHFPADRDRRDARALLAFVMGVEVEDLAEGEVVDARRARRFSALIRRRAGGEPMPHILGWIEFRGLRLRVRPGAFVPRQSSEFTAEQAIRRLHGRAGGVAVDLATGIGPIALAVAAAVPRARVVGTDISDDALRQARANARALDLRNVTFRRGDLFGGLPRAMREGVHVITLHAPYVPRHELRDLPLEIRGFEPEHTLTDYTAHGLSLIERAVAEGRDWLAPGGWLLLEVSPDFARDVRALLVRADYRDVRSTRGWPQVTRVLVGRR
jgi:release factor glutamine methyltransferase